MEAVNCAYAYFGLSGKQGDFKEPLRQLAGTK